MKTQIPGTITAKMSTNIAMMSQERLPFKVFLNFASLCYKEKIKYVSPTKAILAFILLGFLVKIYYC